MLNMNPVVQVNVSVGASSKVASVFDVGAILTSEAGTGAQLSADRRFVVYSSLEELLAGGEAKPAYAATSETYKAAAKYFGVTPTPASLMVIWFNTGSGSTETPVTALATALDEGAEFYGLYYIPKADETAANIKTYIGGFVSALEAIERGVVFYGVAGTATEVTASGSIMKEMFDRETKRAVGMLCTTEENDAAGLMGVAMGYSLTAKERPYALCYKGIATAVANDLTQQEIDDKVKAINGNVFVARTKSGAKIENGTTASGLRFDEVLYIDMIAADIQEGIYETIADSVTKLPMADSSTSLFIGEIYQILERYYNIGVLADSIWRGQPFANYNTGDVIEHGYYAYADSYDTQSETDRLAHKAMPITVIVCLSGSIETIVINLNVQT